MTTPRIELRHVSKTFSGADHAVPALANISFKVMPGEFVTIIGASGSGKSTVCRLSKKARVLHDDLNVVKKNHKGYFLFPGLDMKRKVLPRPGRLRAIFFIKKAKVNKLQRLSLKESFKESLEHCRSLAQDSNIVQRYDDLLDLFKKVPSYRLYFRKDPSFWRLIDNL